MRGKVGPGFRSRSEAGMYVKCAVQVRQIAVLAVLSLVTACSTADYGKPVQDFAAATGKAETALSQLNTQVTEAYSEILKSSIVNRRAFLKVADADCQTQSERCRLVVVDESGKSEPYPPQPPLTNMTRVMAGIRSYAANLGALVEADTVQQVESQVNAALGSVQNLAETVAEARATSGAPPSSVPQFATPVGAAVNWVVGQYVERVKFKGLQRATAAAKPVVRDAADLFRETAGFASDIQRSQLAEEVSQANDAFRSASNAASLAKLEQATAKYDALLTSSPKQLFQRLGDAHDALAESLQADGLSLTDAIAKIEAFATEAKALVKILKDIRAIVPEEQEG